MRGYYTSEGVSRLRKQAQRAARIMAVISVVALAGCILLCMGIRTANADLRQGLVIGLSTLGVFTAICLWEGVRLPALREAEHEAGVLRESAEIHQGRILSIGDAHPILRSITFRPVILEENGEEVSLKLNVRWEKEFPPEGSLIRAETHRGYLTGWETAELPGDGAELNGKTKKEHGTGESDGRRKRKLIFRLLRHGFAGLVASALLWSWIFTFLTDTEAANKVVLYADMREGNWKQLSIALEEEAPEGIRFVQAHPFTFALMDSTALEQADLYIMTENQLAEYEEWVRPWPETAEDGPYGTPLYREGNRVGLRVYSPETGQGAAGNYLSYDENANEVWYLFLGKNSLHSGDLDSAALDMTDALMYMQ